MKKLFIIPILILCLSIPGLSYANFISNPGFEDYTGDDFAFWSEGGAVRVEINPMLVYDGNASAFLRIPGGSLFQSFSITEGDSLYYGAWFLIATDSLASNWDQVQISLQIDSLPWTTIGGSVSDFIDDTSFVWNASLGNYISDWFLIANTVDISSIPVNASININAQNTDSELTKVFVDNSFAEASSVPEPSTLLLLGFGLIGLAGRLRRK